MGCATEHGREGTKEMELRHTRYGRIVVQRCRRAMICMHGLAHTQKSPCDLVTRGSLDRRKRTDTFQQIGVVAKHKIDHGKTRFFTGQHIVRCVDVDVARPNES